MPECLPKRIQMSSKHPWRADYPDAVIVDRRTRWGNPFTSRGLVRYGPDHAARFGREWDYEGRRDTAPAMRHDVPLLDDGGSVETYVRRATRAETVEMFRLTLTAPTPGMLAIYPRLRGHFARCTPDVIRAELAGRVLACWCPLDQPCHADVLLELANGGSDGITAR